jgi:hypothetical protein
MFAWVPNITKSQLPSQPQKIRALLGYSWYSAFSLFLISDFNGPYPMMDKESAKVIQRRNRRKRKLCQVSWDAFIFQLYLLASMIEKKVFEGWVVQQHFMSFIHPTPVWTDCKC